MGPVLFQIGVIGVALAGVAVMLGFKAAASWLLRAAAFLTIGVAIVQLVIGSLGAGARMLFGGGSALLLGLSIGGLALVGWLAWQAKHGSAGGRVAPRPQPRQRALPPPPLPEEPL